VPVDSYGEVLVHCPSCDRRATIDGRGGTLRLTCPHCGLVRDSGFPGPRSVLHVYGSGNTIFGARLWLETACCGGNRLWALNPDHLYYLERFVAERQRTRAFPSPPGSRQLADYLPGWMKTAKHRDEVLRAITRLRATLES
jgi:hypothetical protein